MWKQSLIFIRSQYVKVLLRIMENSIILGSVLNPVSSLLNILCTASSLLRDLVSIVDNFRKCCSRVIWQIIGTFKNEHYCFLHVKLHCIPFLIIGYSVFTRVARCYHWKLFVCSCHPGITWPPFWPPLDHWLESFTANMTLHC